MTTRRKPKTDHAALKTTLVLGSVLATFIGGELLAMRPVQTENLSPPTTLIVPQTDEESTFFDSPLVKLVIPKPVAKSQSSK